MGSRRYRRRMVWRELDAQSYSAGEKRSRRRRAAAWGAWVAFVLIGLVILLAQNPTN